MRQESFRILFLMRKGRTKKDGFATIYARITTGSFRWKIQCKLPPKTKAILPPCAKIILPP